MVPAITLIIILTLQGTRGFSLSPPSKSFIYHREVSSKTFLKAVDYSSYKVDGLKALLKERGEKGEFIYHFG